MEKSDEQPVRVYKTPIYTRNASIAYNKRHPERVKACKERCNERKREKRRLEKEKIADEKAKLTAEPVIPPEEKIKKFFRIAK
jgi:hypothetical protein